MKGLYAVLLATIMLIGLGGQARAQTPDVQIFYDLKHLGGTRYEYTYTVVNNSLTHSSYGYDDSASMIEIFFPARGGSARGSNGHSVRTSARAMQFFSAI